MANITKELAPHPFRGEKATKELKDASAENISLSVPALLLPLLVKLLKNTLSLTRGSLSDHNNVVLYQLSIHHEYLSPSECNYYLFEHLHFK